MAEERFLVTGCMGCLGAWTVKLLAEAGTPVTGFDLSTNTARLELIMGREAAAGLDLVAGDLTDPRSVATVVGERQITHIVHLGALQIPFCRADPVRGAQVNVTGTVNVLEAARHSEGRVRGVAYASSAAVFGPAALYPDGLRDDSPPAPTTLYGVYKVANEGTARIYAADWGVGSVALRPAVVYGPGRDQGMTSTPTVAMLAAAAGRPHTISFSGTVLYQHAGDAAAAFIAAARQSDQSARVFNLGGIEADMSEVVAAIGAAVPGAEVGFEGSPLPFSSRVDDTALNALLDGFRHRPLAEGVAETVATFRAALADGRLQAPA